MQSHSVIFYAFHNICGGFLFCIMYQKRTVPSSAIFISKKAGEQMENVQRILAMLAGAVFAPAFDFLYGKGAAVAPLVTALVFFIVMDWISGIRASKKDDSYGSEYGIDGIYRTFFMLLLPAGGHFLDQIFGTSPIIFGALGAGLVLHVVQSMCANVIRAGWAKHVPVWILEPIMTWVKSEIENKVARATARKEQKYISKEEDNK